MRADINLRREIVNTVLDADEEALERIHTACNRKARPERMVDARKAAQILQVCEKTVFAYAKRGHLQAARQSKRRVRFDLASVEQLAAEGIHGNERIESAVAAPKLEGLPNA